MDNKNSIESRRLSISEMAQIHRISRQTLIYYDKIDLFKPDIVEENGYRFYSPAQIPLLREICFLRSIDIPLDEIRKNNKYNSSASTTDLLISQKAKIEDMIEKLEGQKRSIERRMAIYNKTENSEFKPYIQYFPDRTVIYSDWPGTSHTPEDMHIALMKAWNDSAEFDILPTSLYGTLFEKDDVIGGTPLAHAKSCFIIDSEVNDKVPNVRILEGGEYVCLQKFGMSYDTACLNLLLDWIDENGYEIIGDVYDESLMDATIYDNEDEFDYSELQIPIQAKMFDD